MGKRVIIILLILVVVFICVKFGAAFLTKRALQKETINQVNISKKNDGEYEGYYQIKPVSAKVNVQVADGKITTIDIKEHMTGLGKNGEKIVNKIIDKQSLAVDAVSGATQSSVTIIKAVEDALSKDN
ncbi:FMN-binding protein [Enterococcus gilvus]|uniref:FMN-binding protein n=1 Tax=Enterococcus gilvus TaxID=160453 RepID=UPI001C8BE13F|nr:FMN-binding protein [Enterococcus gilvus]